MLTKKIFLIKKRRTDFLNSMKKSILFLLGSFAAVSSLLFHTQEAKAGKLLDTCRVGSVVILKKNNAGNYVVKYKWGSVLFSDNDEEDARAFFNSFCG